jgi:hypothetical protein
MIPEIDIWRSAHVMVKRYGRDAPIEAARRADALLDEGDMNGHQVWCWIVRAVEELLRVKLKPGERVQ